MRNNKYNISFSGSFNIDARRTAFSAGRIIAETIGSPGLASPEPFCLVPGNRLQQPVNMTRRSRQTFRPEPYRYIPEVVARDSGRRNLDTLKFSKTPRGSSGIDHCSPGSCSSGTHREHEDDRFDTQFRPKVCIETTFKNIVHPLSLIFPPHCPRRVTPFSCLKGDTMQSLNHRYPSHRAYAYSDVGLRLRLGETTSVESAALRRSLQQKVSAPMVIILLAEQVRPDCRSRSVPLSNAQARHKEHNLGITTFMRLVVHFLNADHFS